jgi:arylsulfatase A-like enzyme
MKITYSGSSDEYLNTLPEPAQASLRWKKDQIKLNYPEHNQLAKEIKEAYYATTTFVDAQIGRILKKLKKTGLDKNTIVVFTSDHGYHLGEHGHWQKQTLFENATRVPLIFSGPKVPIGVISNSPVELIDIYPTLTDLTEIETPSHVVGRSLVPVFKKHDLKVRQSALTRWKASQHKKEFEGYSIKTVRYRLTMWGKDGKEGFELYDHRNDKEELINLANKIEYKSILDSLKEHINFRITDAMKKPSGLGRQFEERPLHKEVNYTPGDIHNIQGKRIYVKPPNE